VSTLALCRRAALAEVPRFDRCVWRPVVRQPFHGIRCAQRGRTEAALDGVGHEVSDHLAGDGAHALAQNIADEPSVITEGLHSRSMADRPANQVCAQRCCGGDTNALTTVGQLARAGVAAPQEFDQLLRRFSRPRTDRGDSVARLDWSTAP
jgi:hypothetical protein